MSDLAAVVICAPPVGDLHPALAELGGRPVMARTLEALRSLTDSVVVCLDARDREALGPVAGWLEVVEVERTRNASLAAALRRVSAGWIAVVDSAQPFVSRDSIRRGVEAARPTGAAVAVEPVTDTVKLTRAHVIEATLPRQGLRVLGSPRVFRREVLVQALASVPSAQDEVTAVVACGVNVATFPADPAEVRIGDWLSLARERALLHARMSSAVP